MLNYVGKKIIDDTKIVDKTIPNTDYIKKGELPKGTRIITQDTFVTSDFKEYRLNLYVDSENVVREQRLG